MSNSTRNKNSSNRSKNRINSGNDIPLDEDLLEESFFDEDENEDDEIVEVLLNKESRKDVVSAAKRPIDSHVRYYFYPTWRSQLFPLIFYCIASISCIWISHTVDWLVLEGKLFELGSNVYFAKLPILILVPGFILGKILLYIYDSKYIIDERGVEAQIGLVSLHLRQPRLRWEDIRGVEPNQTLWERILNIGSVLVGSAMTNEVEIVMEGVPNPRAIQLLIGSERDRRLKMSNKSFDEQRELLD